MSRKETRTVCPYCGVGCGLIAETDGDRLTKVSGDPLYPVNRGATCQKPQRLPDAVHAPDRALVPMRRGALDERWRETSWRSAVGEVAGRLRQVAGDHGPESIAFYISGQLLTEDYYAVTKLAKGYLGTNNVDSNSRLCMSSAVAGYVGALGSDGPPASYADIKQTDCLLLLGTNTAACHPIVWSMIRRRQQEGATVIVADPRRTPTAEAADLHLPVRPGADLPLLNSLLHVLDREGMLDDRFVERHTEGAEAMLAVAAEWPPERAAEACGVDAEAIVAAARRFGGARRAMALWSMGANQSTVGTLKNRALNNLCLATGNIGRPGTGPLSLTGQPNAMGGREAGGLAHLLPGYRTVNDADHRAELRRLWDLPDDLPGISPSSGLAATELVDALEAGRVKAVWFAATNPAVSLPDAARFAAALRRADLVVCQDAYHPTETSALAHVVLPAAQWPEKDGTMTNSERRVGLVRKAIEPPGQALPDWEIFARVGRALGHGDAFGWTSAAEVHAEYVRTTEGRPCDQSGLSHARLRREGGVQWPVPARGPEGEDHDGTERLYASRRFPTPSGRARLAATPHADPADRPDADFPLVLTTGRVAQQWHTMTRTSKSPELMSAEPEPFLELHPDDAARAGVTDGDRVRVRSRRGSATLRARVGDVVPEGVAFAPFHWGALHLEPGAGAVNAVTSPACDPVSKQPELKACAVRVEPVGARPSATSPDAVRDRERRRVVIVGAGMAGMAALEAALSHGSDAQFTLVGREAELPYNRVGLSQLLAGGRSEQSVLLRPERWFADRGIDVRSQAGARSIALSDGEVELDDGERVPYDDLVIATGSTAWMPPIAGLGLRGVFPFRSLADTRRILAAAAAARTAVVIGGGLLGLEAARALRERGLRVTVVHLADRLMELQLDGHGARLLRRSIAELGVEVRLSARTERVAGTGCVEAVELVGGDRIAADMVVVATGVRPDVALARDAGLEVARGVLVDDSGRASAPGVWAVGECAEHRGMTYGLWAPLLEQARVVGAALAGRPAAFHGAVPATTLKVAGVDLFCAGNAAQPEDDCEEVVALDSRHARYRKLVLRDGRLVGATLLGDLRDARALRELISGGGVVPDELLDAGASGSGAVAARRRRRAALLVQRGLARRRRERGARPGSPDRRSGRRAHARGHGLRRLPPPDRRAARARALREPRAAGRRPRAAVGAPAARRAPGRALGGHRLLLARLVGVGLGRLEELADLLAHLRRVLVAVHGRGVLGGCADDLFLLADDRQRAVHLAGEAATVGHHSGHRGPPCWSARSSSRRRVRVNPSRRARSAGVTPPAG